MVKKQMKKVYCENCKYYIYPKLDFIWLIFFACIVLTGLLMLIFNKWFAEDFFISTTQSIGVGIIMVLMGTILALINYFLTSNVCSKGTEKKIIYDTPTERHIEYESLGSEQLNKKNNCRYYQRK